VSSIVSSVHLQLIVEKWLDPLTVSSLSGGKGLTLAKPEMVPFRLTQNLIDGFGITGIEGVFRKTCEISLQVNAAE
jgi:hypothetical protein